MKSILFLLILLSTFTLNGQELPRQGNWGIRVKKMNSDSTNSPIVISGIVPNSTEAQIGLQKDDLLYKINDSIINSIEDVYFNGLLPALRNGDEICYEIFRPRIGELKLCGKVAEKAREKSEFSEIIYDRVSFKEGFLSTIITKPISNKKLPVIYFIPGYNCASYDNLPFYHPYKKIIDSLTHLGYAVFRCEKSGMGDSYQTPNCFDIDFNTEQKGFEAGYQKLLTYDFIDTNLIYIFGHSLGGINAPLLAEKFRPKGVIVYGTTHLPWMEYLQNMLRFQNSKLGMSPVEVENDLRLYQTLLYKHYVEKLSPSELIELNPDFERLLVRDFQYIGGDLIFQRHYTFMQQLNDLNLSKTWSNVNCFVLSIFGEADFEALNSDAHKEIVRIVNQYHLDKATFLLLPETNHSFIKIGSMEDEIESKINGSISNKIDSHFNFQIITEIHNWINHLNKP